MAFLQVPSDKAAAQLVFCLDRLRELAEAQPEQAHVWRARARVLEFLVAFYDLRSIAERRPLSDEERKRIAATAGLLRAPAKGAPHIEGEEARELREEVRRTFAKTAFSRHAGEP